MTSVSGEKGPAAAPDGDGPGHRRLSGDLTLQTYEEAAEDYRRHRRNEIPPPIQTLLERTVALVPKGAQCLEIGSGPWQLVLANAVLLHLSRMEFAAALRKVRGALAAEGVFAVTLKEGDGEEWHTRKLGLPRHFTYWREPALRAELDSAGWRVEHLEHVAGPNDDWLHVVARAV